MNKKLVIFIAPGILIIIFLIYFFGSLLTKKAPENNLPNPNFIPPTSIPINYPSLIAPTNSITKPTITANQQTIQQAMADKAFGERQKQIIKTYPWFLEFPILTNNYFLYFDLQKKNFIAKLYPKTENQIPLDTQVTNYKTEILQKINSLNINTTQYPVLWNVVLN